MRGFHLSFPDGFRSSQNVSCFLCAESHREIRKQAMKTLVNIVETGFPALATVLPLGNMVFPLSFLEGFQ